MPLNWNDALQTSATGCQQTDSSSIRTRLSYSGSDRDRVFPSKAVVFQYCSSVPTLLQPVRLLGVTLSSDLSLARHVSTVSASGFYWLRQLRRSLDMESAATLVHAFVSSRVDYCNAVLAGSSKATTDRLQCTTSAQCRCPCRQWYEEVQPRLIAAAAH